MLVFFGFADKLLVNGTNELDRSDPAATVVVLSRLRRSITFIRVVL